MPSFPLTVEGVRVERHVSTYKGRNVYVNEYTQDLPEAPSGRFSSRSRFYFIGWDNRGPERRYTLKVEGTNAYGSEIGDFEVYESQASELLRLRSYQAGKVAIRIVEELALSGEPVATLNTALRQLAEEEGLLT